MYRSCIKMLKLSLNFLCTALTSLPLSGIWHIPTILLCCTCTVYLSVHLQWVSLECISGCDRQGALRPCYPPATGGWRHSDFVPQPPTHRGQLSRTPARPWVATSTQGPDNQWRAPPSWKCQIRERRPSFECIWMGTGHISATVGEVRIQLLLCSGRAVGVGQSWKYEALPTNIWQAKAATRQEYRNQWRGTY